MPQDNKTIEVLPMGIPQPDSTEQVFNQSFDRTMEIRDLIGLLPTLTAAPTYVPRKFSEQVVIAVAGGANSLYVYDVTNNLWRAATLGT